MSPTSILERILQRLEELQIPYQKSEHAPIASAEEAATVRGTPLELGVKAILFKIDRSFAICAMSAAKSLHSAKLRKALRAKRTRFATRDELLEMTGLLPGAVPPFGEPVLPFPLYADPSVLDRKELVFTAGSRSVSIRLAAEDYRRVASPRVLELTR